MSKDDGRHATPERPSTVTVPIDVMEQIDRAIKFYASFETYLPPRIAGVLGGCERSGDIPVIVDRGRNAMDVLTQLIKLYPMVQTPQSESAPIITAKFLEESGYVLKGGPRLTYQGGDNIAPTAIEHYNPETGHAVLEFVGIPPLLLEKGKESQYVKRYLYWAALTKEGK